MNENEGAPLTQLTPIAPVSEDSFGVTLQRGGEELMLKKFSDRFTIALNPPNSPFPGQIPTLGHRPIPKTPLTEVLVEPSALEQAMKIARRLDNIAFASHIYQFDNGPQTRVYLTNEIVIQWGENVSEAEIATTATQYQIEPVKPVRGLPNTFIYRLGPTSTENPLKLANRLIGHPQILATEPNIIIRQESFYRPKDDLYPQQWYLQHQGGSELVVGSHIEIEKAWDITRGKRSVVVAIADDAIDLNHPDLQGEGKIVAPIDFNDNDFLPLPSNSQESHGTACAGVAVAEETGRGIVGVAPGCALMPMRTTGYLDDESIEQIFDWAIDKGASVISCSWGAAVVHFPLSLRQQAAIHRAATQGRGGKGCVIVFAAGNANRPVSGTVYERQWPQKLLDGPTEWLSGFPAHPDVIAVAASTSMNKKSAYSNWGTHISVCAPSNNAPPGMWFAESGFIQTAPNVTTSLQGRGIFTADLLGELGYDPGNFTRDFGGTSSACPVVAGVAALVLSVNPDLSALEVKQILQQTADKIVDRDRDPQLGLQLGTYDQNGHSQWFGYGKVNAYQAVLATKQRSTTTPTPARTVVLSNMTPVNIPDNNPTGALSRISITEKGTIRDIQISVDIEHQFLGDIEVSLRPPVGEPILLTGRTLGSRTQLKTTYTLKTNPALKQVLGQGITGMWYLWLVDRVAGDAGRLKSWELKLGVG